MERPWFVVSPKNTRVQRWNLVILAAMFYVSTITPYEVSVMSGDAHPVLRGINYAVDAVFACDLLLQFFVGFWDPALKATCYDPWRIARRYSASWLALDVVSIFPFDEAAKGNDQLSTLRVVRIVRRLALLRTTGVKRRGGYASSRRGANPLHTAVLVSRRPLAAARCVSLSSRGSRSSGAWAMRSRSSRSI